MIDVSGQYAGKRASNSPSSPKICLEVICSANDYSSRWSKIPDCRRQMEFGRRARCSNRLSETSARRSACLRATAKTPAADAIVQVRTESDRAVLRIYRTARPICFGVYVLVCGTRSKAKCGKPKTLPPSVDATQCRRWSALARTSGLLLPVVVTT